VGVGTVRQRHHTQGEPADERPFLLKNCLILARLVGQAPGQAGCLVGQFPLVGKSPAVRPSHRMRESVSRRCRGTGRRSGRPRF